MGDAPNEATGEAAPKEATGDATVSLLSFRTERWRAEDLPLQLFDRLRVPNQRAANQLRSMNPENQ